jgi:nucleoid DNA-binding protein
MERGVLIRELQRVMRDEHGDEGAPSQALIGDVFDSLCTFMHSQLAAGEDIRFPGVCRVFAKEAVKTSRNNPRTKEKLPGRRKMVLKAKAVGELAAEFNASSVEL